jgi:carbon storage regulator
MLVLSRKKGEKIVLGETIVLTILRIEGNKVRIGIEAETDVAIVRGELVEEGAQTRPLIGR